MCRQRERLWGCSKRLWCLCRDSGPQNGRRDFSSRGSGEEAPAAEALPGPPPLPAAPPKKKVLSAAVVVGSSLAEVGLFLPIRPLQSLIGSLACCPDYFLSITCMSGGSHSMAQMQSPALQFLRFAAQFQCHQSVWM